MRLNKLYKASHQRIAQDQMALFLNSIKHLKKVLVFILFESFQKTEEEGILPNTFYEASITLITKTDKDTMKKKTISQHF
jgi:hypothetical protein